MNTTPDQAPAGSGASDPMTANTTATPRGSELLPCPFCGSAGERDPGWGGYAKCSNMQCVLGGPDGPDCNWFGERHWNTRAAIESAAAPGMGGDLQPPPGDTFSGWAAWLRDQARSFDPYVQQPHAEQLAQWLDRRALATPTAPASGVSDGEVTEELAHAWSEVWQFSNDMDDELHEALMKLRNVTAALEAAALSRTQGEGL